MRSKADSVRDAAMGFAISPGKALLLSAAAVLGLGLLLRVLFLGNVFQSSDNAALASRIVSRPGYSWMWREYFGVMINFLVKVWAAALSALGITLTETLWKLPVAIAGSLQAPLLLLFLRRLGCSSFSAWSGAAMSALLPIHVMWSRFPWGYEILGVFFCTMALWALLRFWQAPGRKTGLLASLAVGLYLISHGFIIPFIPSFIIALLLFAPDKTGSFFSRIYSGVICCSKNYVWLFPLLFSPLCLYPLAHTLSKKTRLGFYLGDHFSGLLADTGIFFLALLLLAALAYGASAKIRSQPIITLFGFTACAYLAPLFLGTPPGVTIARDYLLMGIYFWMLFAILVLDRLLAQKAPGRWLWSICLACTLWGNVNQFFLSGRGWDPSRIEVFRGACDPDPGSKAAGYLVQKHLPQNSTLLVLHRNIEPPNLLYYFRRQEISFYDLDLAQSREAYLAIRKKADVVIADREQAALISGDPRFTLRIVLRSQNIPRLWLFSRREIPFPELDSETRPFNRLFDREFSWKVPFI
ncbi:MAG: glycosyltransferase family 39 protein [Acidobacteriota bacterium]|nr:glycosyltransferase family 39 protein [Acidobacteriota bacterium]